MFRVSWFCKCPASRPAPPRPLVIDWFWQLGCQHCNTEDPLTTRAGQGPHKELSNKEPAVILMMIISPYLEKMDVSTQQFGSCKLVTTETYFVMLLTQNSSKLVPILQYPCVGCWVHMSVCNQITRSQQSDDNHDQWRVVTRCPPPHLTGLQN